MTPRAAADLDRRRARGGRAHRRRRAPHAAAALAHARRAHRRTGGAEGREPPARRRLQVPRRVQRGGGAAPRRRVLGLLGQPRPGAGARRARARRAGDDPHATRRPCLQACGHRGLWRRGDRVRPLRRRPRRAGPRARRRARVHARAPLRRPARDGRPGHRRPRAGRRARRPRHGGGPGRRRRADRRRGDGGQGAAPAGAVVGVEPEAGDDVARSLRAGERVSVEVPQTIADGQQVTTPGERPWEVIRALVDDVVTVSRRRDRRRHAAALRAREGRGRAQRRDRARRACWPAASRCAAGRWAWSSAAATSTPRASPPSSRLDRTSAESDRSAPLPWPAMLPFLRLCRGRARGRRRARRARGGAGARAHPGGPGRRRNGAGRHAAHVHRARAGSARRPRRALARGGRRLRRHRRGRRAPRRHRRRRRDPSLVQFTAPAGLAAGEWFWQVGNPADCSAGPVRRITIDGSGATTPATPGTPAVTPTPPPAGSAAQARARPDPVAHRHEQPRAARPCARRGLALGLAQPLRRPRAQQRPPLAPRRARPGQAHPPPGRRARRRRLRRRPRLARARWAPPRCCARTTCASGACARPAGCRTTRTPAGTRVVERDLALLPDVPWAQGPAHPTSEEYDLETVVLHELGHWAGNLRHTPVGCHDTPMVKGLGPGEWWRSSERLALRRLRRGRARAASALDVPSLTAPRPLHHRARRRADRRRPWSTTRAPSASSGRPASSTTATGSVTIDGEPVDDPDSLKGDPIPGGPTDPNAGRPDAERNSD